MKNNEDEGRSGDKGTEEEENATKILLVVVAIHAIFILPFIAYYTPSGQRGVFFYYLTNKTLDWNEFQRTTESISKIPVTSETTLTLLLHGFCESSHKNWVQNLAQAILSRENGHNIVMVVDYWDFHRPNYSWLKYNAMYVSTLVSDVIDKLVLHKNLQLSRTHVIGFSLGGQMSGMIGSQLKTGKLGRITALDPASPRVDAVDIFHDLDLNDAEMVVVVRTSLFSSESPAGDVDFFVNGGDVQPGCDVWWYPHFVQQACSHLRAVKVVLEAETEAGRGVFPSCLCPDYTSFKNGSCPCQVISHFDLSTFTSPGGQFYFITNEGPPYNIPLNDFI